MVIKSVAPAAGKNHVLAKSNVGDSKNQEQAQTVPLDGFTPSPIDQKEFRNVLGQFATGVAVITTEDEGGDRAGMTVSSFTSLSMDPPLVLFCAKEGSKTMAEVLENGHFAVSILRDEQKDLCYQFAGKAEADKFQGVSSHPGEAYGDPLLQGAIATLECRLSRTHPGGDHTIVIGEVIGLSKTPEDDQPLLFWDGKVQPSK